MNDGQTFSWQGRETKYLGSEKYDNNTWAESYLMLSEVILNRFSCTFKTHRL